MTPTQLQQVKTALKQLADILLMDYDVPKSFSDEDLVNVATVFKDIITNKWYEVYRPLLTDDEMNEKSLEMGKTLRQFILTYTKVDMHEAVRGKKTNLS